MATSCSSERTTESRTHRRPFVALQSIGTVDIPRSRTDAFQGMLLLAGRETLKRYIPAIGMISTISITE